jgi:hypothetical protein
MKSAMLFGITLLAATPVFAQTSTTPAPGSAAQSHANTVTLTGCVGGGNSGAMPITLTNALAIPGTAQPGQLDQTPSPLPPASSATGTQPSDPTLPPPSSAPVSPTATPAPAPTSPVGTSGTKTPSSTGTSGSSVAGVTGTAPAGSSASSVSGYTLSGVDMKPWVGKRVQVIGTFAPATSPSASATPSASGAASLSAMREFRVQTVQPATGPCPK